MIRPEGPTNVKLLTHCISIVKSFLLMSSAKQIDQQLDQQLIFLLSLFDT